MAAPRAGKVRSLSRLDMAEGKGDALYRAEGSTLRTASAPILDSRIENAAAPAVGHPGRTPADSMRFESLLRDQISERSAGGTDSTPPRSTTAASPGQSLPTHAGSPGSENELQETTALEAQPSGALLTGGSPAGFVFGEPKLDAMVLPGASLRSPSLATIEEQEPEPGVPAAHEAGPANPDNDSQVKKEALSSSTAALGARSPAFTQPAAKPVVIADMPAISETPVGRTTVQPFGTAPEEGVSPAAARRPAVVAIDARPTSETDVTPIVPPTVQPSATSSGPSPITQGPAGGNTVVSTARGFGGTSEVSGLQDAAPATGPERPKSQIAGFPSQLRSPAPVHAAESGMAANKKTEAAGVGGGSTSQKPVDSEKTKRESTSRPAFEQTRGDQLQPKGAVPCGGAVPGAAPVAIPQNPASAGSAAVPQSKADGSVRHQPPAAHARAGTGGSEEIRHAAGDPSGKSGSIGGHAGFQKADASSGVHGEAASQRSGTSTLQTSSGAGIRTLAAGSSNFRTTNFGAAGIPTGPAASRGATEQLREMPGKVAAPLNAAGAFERLDSAAAPQMIASTPQRLTVGVQSGGLGWVEIRAHTAQGLVSTTLATASVESQHAVAAELPSIRESLSGAQVQVGDLRSEVFSAPSGNRGGSQQDQSQGGSSSGRTTGQDEGPPGASVETETEALSYINVRV